MVRLLSILAWIALVAACRTVAPGAAPLPAQLAGLKVFTRIEPAADRKNLTDQEIEEALRETNAALAQAGLEIAESPTGSDLFRNVSVGAQAVTVTFESGGRLLEGKTLRY